LIAWKDSSLNDLLCVEWDVKYHSLTSCGLGLLQVLLVTHTVRHTLGPQHMCYPKFHLLLLQNHKCRTEFLIRLRFLYEFVKLLLLKSL